ncbi:protein translocase SEC61 complex subunit gamma [Candidatus Woesearchaeota archaeon]|nr:protein translocase SEC61 complex subunit gamma [Candidatus Woesearchaeota archaeon]
MDLLLRLKEFTLESRRVLRITKKPTSDELRTIVKVSGIGIMLIGFIGFLMHLLNEILIQR